ncbi:MAG: hypothetical protein K2X86_12730 [Cytophagaceae bacterium]|nr:hypothetical protein [Cytophagaceae bacterium]
MKRSIFSIFFICLAFATFAKSISATKVPVMVKANFYNAYPTAKHVKWEETDLHDFKAAFRVGDDYGAAYYDAEGKFIEADQTVEWTQVPFSGRMDLYHHNSGHITNVLKIETGNHEIFYQIDLKNKHKKTEILLDKEGNIIKA